jgi:hypothetical protein
MKYDQNPKKVKNHWSLLCMLPINAKLKSVLPALAVDQLIVMRLWQSLKVIGRV